MHLAGVLKEVRQHPGADQALPVLTLTERNGFVRQADRFKKRLATDDTSGYKVIKLGQIAFNPYLLWAAAIAQNTIVPAGVISPLYPTFEVREGNDPAYVRRLLLSPEMVKAYDSISFGSVPRRRRSSTIDFLGLKIPPLPPLDEQRRIAAILDQADALRALHRGRLRHLEGFIDALFQEMFGGRAGSRVLSDIATVSSGITKGRRTAESTVDVPYLAVSNVQSGRLDLTTVKTIAATAPEIERYSLAQFDLVLTEGGDPDKLGRGTVWMSELPLAIHQNHIFRVRMHDASADYASLLSAYLRSDAARRYFIRAAKQTTGIASINMSQLKRLPVIEVGDQELRDFQTASTTTLHRIAEANTALSAMDALFASLQARAFRGEL